MLLTTHSKWIARQSLAPSNNAFGRLLTLAAKLQCHNSMCKLSLPAKQVQLCFRRILIASAAELTRGSVVHHCAVSSLLVGLMLMSPYGLGCSRST